MFSLSSCDPDICGCPCDLKDTISGTIDGIVACGGCFSSDNSYSISGVTGINGVFDFVKVENEDYWRVELGAFIYTVYAGTNCISSPISFTILVTGFIVCGQDSTAPQVILIGNYEDQGYPQEPFPPFAVFQVFSGFGDIEQSIPNSIVCSDGNIGDGTVFLEEAEG